MGEQIIVDTVEGKLLGCVGKNLDGEEFYSFLGVPYAKPPVGELRFKAPQPLEPWSGVKDATKEGIQFYQRDNLNTFTKIVSGTENGLHLNVFTKKLVSQCSNLNPVMVWIHGGGFREGRNNTDIYGPEFLMLEDVVLVVINYRLGILGSLKLEDPSLEVYGNANMKDQVAALKWVQRNIRNFGGDPNNVTIFGESAGGASVQYLVLSPVSKGLFHKAIMQSGVVINCWAYGFSYINVLKEAIGRKNCSDKELLEHLRNISVPELFELQEKYIKKIGSFSPVAEIPNPTAFITKRPFEYLISGNYNKVPILMGYCSNECLFMKPVYSQTILDQYTPKYCVKEILEVEEDDENIEKFATKLKDFYGETDASKIKLTSDYRFILGVIGCAVNHAKTSNKPVYLYRLSLDSGRNYCKRANQIDGQGVSHLDDLGYLFKTTLPLPKKGTPEDSYVRRFVKLWTNFTKYGNPTPENNDLGIKWKPVTETVVNFLDIDENLIPAVDPESDAVKIWREIFQKNPKTAKYL